MPIVARLREKLGDFWFYSLLLFLAARTADAIHVFIGLYLVPKYVDASELGAVMPLTTFASLLALPAYIFATTFMKEVNALAAEGRYGQLKTLMRGVFVAVAIFLVLAIVASRLVLPLFLHRIRIVEGSLGFLILASAFVGCVSPVYSNALQALKRFNMLAIISVVGAPLRLVAMLVAMPFRALSGYFVGQAVTPAFTILASLFGLRKELRLPAEPYWTKAVFRRFAALFMFIAAYNFAGMLVGMVQMTILRQRLPEVESAAYYMTSRFSEIANFLSMTLYITMFPYTAEMAGAGKSTRPMVLKCSLAMAVFSGLLAGFFALFGRDLLSLLPSAEQYAAYSWAIPWLIAIAAMSSVYTFHATTEISASRFGFLKWWVPVNLLMAAVMMLVTGYGYFTAWLPPAWAEFLREHNVTSLTAFLIWLTADAAIKLIFTATDLFRQRPSAL